MGILSETVEQSLKNFLSLKEDDWNGKKALFENRGYTIEDSAYLQQLYISQALQKYCNGNYVFKGTNDFTVKIKIILNIETPQKKNCYTSKQIGLYCPAEKSNFPRRFRDIKNEENNDE